MTQRAFHDSALPLFAADADEAVGAAPIETGRMPSYIADHRKRLRERFHEGGPGAVAEYELLELLLFNGSLKERPHPWRDRLHILLVGIFHLQTLPAAAPVAETDHA